VREERIARLQDLHDLLRLPKHALSSEAAEEEGLHNRTQSAALFTIIDRLRKNPKKEEPDPNTIIPKKIKKVGYTLHPLKNKNPQDVDLAGFAVYSCCINSILILMHD